MKRNPSVTNADSAADTTWLSADGEASPPGADERAAFARAVYERHGAALLRFATAQLGGDIHRAEDIVQEAVLRAWRHADALGHDPEGIRPWLLRVIRNLSIDGHRARQARPQEAGEVEPSDVVEPDHAERALTKQLVLRALKDLSPQHREVLVHVQYLDHSVGETAKILGIPPGTVKSRTHLALRALRTALGEHGYRP